MSIFDKMLFTSKVFRSVRRRSSGEKDIPPGKFLLTGRDDLRYSFDTTVYKVSGSFIQAAV
ncbi:hypothetical protein D7X88_06730 [bacterium C-53]|nr:hypothetical protein [Lachnospiraceae bacterium]NBI02915.1 hypothetical protein [Lachnospiraceae bacterium]RKJ11038.1 hypothetical protein D7X88_06730 [bacterium C-53]